MHEIRHAQTKPLAGTIAVFLTNFVTDVLIGIYPNERTRSQKMRIDIKVTMSHAAMPDTINDVLDYNVLRDGVRTIIDAGHIDFQEIFCERIVAMCLSLPRVSNALVTVAKLEAFSDCEAVGCEISRSKEREPNISYIEPNCLPPGFSP